MKLESLKEGVGNLWDNVTEGWRHLRRSAAGALTRFTAGGRTDLPAAGDVDDAFYMPTRGWAMLGGDVFEDENRLVVRVEVPGMDKQDINIEIRDDAMVISGEKRFERENTDGRWRVMQCAYGSFYRAVPLPAQVLRDKASATYKNGVLRVELPKARTGKPKSHAIKVT